MKIGIIGGSGLDNPGILSDLEDEVVDTPYGKPSSVLTCGKIEGVEVVILARHGKNHEIPPSEINFRANIWALKEKGCDYIIAFTAVGSLREEIKPGNIVFPNQFIDFTKKRKMTFFDKIGDVVHSPMSEPFDKNLREIFIEGCKELNIEYNTDATVITIEGPRFSTKAESYMFRQWGGDIINMSTCPEVILANELEIPYQNIAMSTDYDCWKENEEPVTFEAVLKTMKENADKVKNLLILAIPKIACIDEEYIKSKIRAVPDFPKHGIMFRDITTLLSDNEGIGKVIKILYNRYKNKKIDVVVGIESRGFIIGGIIAEKLGVSFVPIRKPGKLPYETISEEYKLEYGTDKLEMHIDAIKKGDNVLVVDDLIATGGTAVAACNLVEKASGKIEECAFIIDLCDLGGKNKLIEKGYEVFSIVSFED